MSRPRRWPTLLALLLVALPAGAEEEAHHRACPDYPARMAGVRRVALAAPQLKLYELTAGNDRVFKPDWSEEAAGLVAAALEEALRARGLEVGRLEAGSPEAREELRQVMLLHESVVGGVIQATYANRFPAKVERFDYGYGDLSPLLGGQADALLIAVGAGHISSGGRKAVQALSAVFSGVTSKGIDRIYLALVDRGGTLLWFDWNGSTQHDLRDPQSARQFVQVMTARLPPVGR